MTSDFCAPGVVLVAFIELTAGTDQSPMSASSSSGCDSRKSAEQVGVTHEQLVGQAFVKAAHIILDGRVIRQDADHKKTRKGRSWFNIHVDELCDAKGRLEQWKSEANLGLPLVLDIFVCPASLKHPLPTSPSDESKMTLIERWCIGYVPIVAKPPLVGQSYRRSSPRALYKRMSLMMRSLFSLLRILPAQRLRKMAERNEYEEFVLDYRIHSNVRKIDDHAEAYEFAPVETADGRFTVKVMYVDREIESDFIPCSARRGILRKTGDRVQATDDEAGGGKGRLPSSPMAIPDISGNRMEISRKLSLPLDSRMSSYRRAYAQSPGSSREGFFMSASPDLPFAFTPTRQYVANFPKSSPRTDVTYGSSIGKDLQITTLRRDSSTRSYQMSEEMSSIGYSVSPLQDQLFGVEYSLPDTPTYLRRKSPRHRISPRPAPMLLQSSPWNEDSSLGDRTTTFVDSKEDELPFAFNDDSILEEGVYSTDDMCAKKSLGVQLGMFTQLMKEPSHGKSSRPYMSLSKAEKLIDETLHRF